MTYDGPDHGTMEQFQKGLDYWQGRGLEPGKTVMGVPFYSEPANIIYRKIVEADPAAAERDSMDYFGTTIHYNGQSTIQEKTRIAMEQAVWPFSVGGSFYPYRGKTLDEEWLDAGAFGVFFTWLEGRASNPNGPDRIVSYESGPGMFLKGLKRFCWPME